MLNHPRHVWVWALYDWANSAFATSILAGFFPIFFKSYWAKDLSSSQSSFELGLANTIGSLIMLVGAPLLGVLGNRFLSRKHLTFGFALFGALAGLALFLLPAGQWRLAQLLFILMLVCFSSSLVFYDAMLLDITTADARGKVSALGYAMGYLGGGILLAINVAWVSFPDFFGFANATQAVRFAFLSVALWWLLFSLPLLWLPHQPPNDRALGWDPKLLWRHKKVLWFLLAYWFYIDGVDTVVRMAVDYGLALGFSQNHLIVALLITQFVGLPATLAYAGLIRRLGYRRAIMVGILVYMAICIWASQLRHVSEFYLMAVAVGLVQGGVQASSRAYFAELIPAERASEFFGIYNMFGKFAAIIGPVMMGAISHASGDPRLGVIAVLGLFGVGLLLLGKNQGEDHRGKDGACNGC